MKEKHEQVKHLTPYRQIEFVAPFVKHKGIKTTGEKAANLWKWTRPEILLELERLCRPDPSKLGKDGKHKGGRGNKKVGQARTSRTQYKEWFDEEEKCVNKTMEEQREKRLRVTSGDVKGYMRVELEKSREAGCEDPRKVDWTPSKSWLRGFLKRFGWVKRRATNKRAHSAEDPVGDLTGFIIYLKQLRQDNPREADETWGMYGLLNTLNSDSVPMPFCNPNKITLEKKGASRVSIQVPGSGLDKRQFTLHITIRPIGEQPWVTIIMKGSTDLDSNARAREMKEFAKFNVHVIWQASAWFDGYVASKKWVRKCLAKDLERIANNMDKAASTAKQVAEEFRSIDSPDIEDVVATASKAAADKATEAGFFRRCKKLMLVDNLGSQRAKEFYEACEQIDVTLAYGPRNGTDIWQPVDHGIGHEYHVRVGRKYDLWTKTDEAQAHFRRKTYPDAPRRRLLMVIWVHEVYQELELKRKEKERRGEQSIFRLAFARTGMLVSANGDEDVDKEIKPEGMEAAIQRLKSKDSYYKDHGICDFRDLLKCKSSNCGHVQPRPPLPPLPPVAISLDDATTVARFKELETSKDPRAEFIVKCLKYHMKWAGSSFIVFMGGASSGYYCS